MNENEAKAAVEAVKRFRKKYFIKEDTESPDWAALKRAQRSDQYDRGWINFSITCPKRCADVLKSAYEQYQKSHPDEFTSGETPEEPEKE